MRKSAWVTVLLLSISAVTFAEEEPPTENGDKNPPFRVAGIVVDEDGQPVAGAHVDALYDGAKTSTRADDNGQFTLELPRKPLWTLVLRAAEVEGHQQGCGAYAAGESSRSLLERFLPRVESLPDHVKLVLRPPRKIEAVVVDSRKQPVSDARLMVQGTWYDKIAEAQSDADGKATLIVPTDSPLYAIVARKDGAGLDYFLYENFHAEKSNRYRLPRDHSERLTFVLSGARHITVQVVDDKGQPLRDAKVSPWAIEKPHKGTDRGSTKNHFDGGTLYSGIEDLRETTNAEGLATFDFWPADCLGGASFLGSAPGYMSFKAAFVPAGSEDSAATLTLFRTLRLAARVIYNDGRPAAGTWLWVYQEALDDGRNSGPSGAHSASAIADEQGRLAFTAFPNHFLLLRTMRKEWAAPLTTCILQDEPPDLLEIVLQRATHVHGRLTAGPDQARVPNQQIGISRHVEDAYRQLRERGLALKTKAGRTRPIPESDVNLLVEQSVSTNGEGEFEAFLGVGEYQFRYGEKTALDIKLGGEAEREVNLHAERPTHADLVGRVVFEGREQKGAANARITGYYLPKEGRHPSIETTADANGTFRLARQPFDLLLYARDENGLFAKIVRAAADDQTAVISLSKAASAHGKLTNAATGEPVRNVHVAFGIPWEGLTTLAECGGGVQTDEQGQFDVAGLVPGQKYRFTFYAHGRPQDHFTAFTPSDPESYALGEYRVDVSGKGLRTATGLVAPKDAPAVFHLDDDDVDGRIAAAQQQAKAENKWVLLLFGADWSAWSHRLNTFLHDNAEVAAALQESFVVILVDEQNLGDGSRKDALAKRFLHSQSRLPVLVVLDADGNQVASAGELENGDDHYDSAKILEFLEQAKHAPAVPLRGRAFGRRRPARQSFQQD